MTNSNYKLNINGEAFASMREDFDKILKRTVNNMEEKASNNAEITIKLKIELIPSFLPPQQSDQEGRAILKPKFEHKVSSVMNTKFEESGSLKGDYELVWDEEAQDYIAKPIGYTQTTIFDTENKNYVEYEEVDTECPQLPEGPTSEDEECEESDDENIIEEDFAYLSMLNDIVEKHSVNEDQENDAEL